MLRVADLKLDRSAPWVRTLLRERPKAWIPLFVAELDNPDEEIQAVASFALAAYGAEVVPRLIAVLGADRPAAREAAAFSLKSIGPAARPALERLLAREDLPRGARREAKIAYYSVAPDRRADLLAGLTRDLAARERAIAILRGMHADAVPLLIGALASSDDRLRTEAAALLGEFGVAAVPAIPALGRIVAGKAPRPALWAAVSLCRLLSHARAAAPILAAAVGPDRPELSIAICNALHGVPELGSRLRAAVEACRHASDSGLAAAAERLLARHR